MIVGIGLLALLVIIPMMVTQCSVSSETAQINLEDTKVTRLTREGYIQKLSEMRGTSFEAEQVNLDAAEEKDVVTNKNQSEEYATLSKIEDLGAGQKIEIVAAVTIDVENNLSGIKAVDEVNIVAIGTGDAKWENSLAPRVVNIQPERFEVIYKGTFEMENTYSATGVSEFEEAGFKVSGNLASGGTIYIGKSVGGEVVIDYRE